MPKLISILFSIIFLLSIICNNAGNSAETGKIHVRLNPNQHLNVVRKPAAHHNVPHSSENGKIKVRVNPNSHLNVVRKPAAAAPPVPHSGGSGKLKVRLNPNQNLQIVPRNNNDGNNNNKNINNNNTNKKKITSVRNNQNDRNSAKIFIRKKNTNNNNRKPINKNQSKPSNKKVNVKFVHNKAKPPPPKTVQKTKWKPKPQQANKKPPGKKYSGWKPMEWANNTNMIIDENGEMLNRTSQTKFEEYMKEIFGVEDYDSDDILTPNELNGRELADPGEYPHMVAVGLIRDFEDIIDWKCGGSLISRQFVLTAAHCCSFGGENPTHVELGAIDIRKPSKDREDSIVTEIEEVTIHPYYEDEAYYYDIGLLKLVKPVTLSRNVRPVQLWPLEYVPYEFAFACGYGATAFGKVQTNVLTEMNLDLIGNEKCNQSMPILEETPFGILDNQLCALDLDGIVDTCQGDSGGPLQLNLPGRRRPRHSLIGIVSYGVFCGSSYPGVYTRVFSYLNWIESIVWPRTYSYFNPDFVFLDN